MAWGKKIKCCLVSILQRSQKSKTSFFLFLGGGGGKVKVHFVYAVGAPLGNGRFDFPLGLSLPWWPWAGPRASEQLLYQGYFHLPS